ncbi:MAG: Gfo/Idh/MocA family oxidoreductase [Anaerolineae bacterium]|nr:Gfo/Idh/MocA family oxidoreductase [Anaerolineae bacterium]
MTQTIGWGILGAGRIAGKFATESKLVPGTRLVAVGSRSAEKAEEFARQNGVERAYGSYAKLVADPEVDAVYVATLHPTHCEHTLLALDAGKAVLCEKPFAVTGREARQMIERARERRLFLMEAMWARFNPMTVQVRRWLAEGRIGEPRMMTIDFGFRAAWNPESRLLNPALAGGALLDVGVYVLAYASMVFGRPTQIQAAAHIGESGVDEQTAMALKYAGGQIASLTCAVRTPSPQGARIDGTEGAIEIPAFWRAPVARLIRPKEDPVEATGDFGFQYEIAEAVDCLRAGKIESPHMPLDETLAIAETMDEVRRQIGLRYPFE